jgi:hypothetical protein
VDLPLLLLSSYRFLHSLRRLRNETQSAVRGRRGLALDLAGRNWPDGYARLLDFKTLYQGGGKVKIQQKIRIMIQQISDSVFVIEVGVGNQYVTMGRTFRTRAKAVAFARKMTLVKILKEEK